MPMPAVGSIGTAYDIAPSMHDQYSPRFDDNDDDNLSYSFSRPQNINHICDDDIDNNDDMLGRDDDVLWNDDSAAYASRFCVAILSFDGMLL